MKHFNDHFPCIVHIQTNGVSPIEDEIAEIVVIPFHDFVVSKTILPFNVKISVAKQGTLTLDQYAACTKYGMDTHLAEQAFEHWYAKLGLRPNKQILPIAFDWPKQYGFLKEWFGYLEGFVYMEDFFSRAFRDVLPVSIYWADLAAMNDEYIPFPKQTLTCVARRLGVPTPKSKTLLDRAYHIGVLYDKLTSLILPTGVDLPLCHPLPIDYQCTSEQSEYDFEEE